METPVAAAAIAVEHVNKTYGRLKAVEDISFAVPSSASFGLLGPNGAGKTTLMKMLYGKARRDRTPGSAVRVFGFDPARQALKIKCRTGVVPQEDNLDVELNVRQNLSVYARFHGLSAAQTRARVDRLLDFMELSDKRRALIRELSGGMKRRLLIVRALMGDPRLLILDEPTTGLDPQVRHLIWDKLRLLKKQGVAVLLTTHYMEEAHQLCDEILILDKGRKVLAGRPADLLAREIEAYVLEIADKKLLPSLAAKADFRLRREEAGERVFYYGSDLRRLKKMTAQAPPGSYMLRPANLEDLFLKITGRNLHEVQ